MASTLNISDIRLFNLMKNKFGEKEAEEFVSLIKGEIEEVEAKIKISESKFQIVLPFCILWIAEVAMMIILITVSIKQ